MNVVVWENKANNIYMYSLTMLLIQENDLVGEDVTLLDEKNEKIPVENIPEDSFANHVIIFFICFSLFFFS